MQAPPTRVARLLAGHFTSLAIASRNLGLTEPRFDFGTYFRTFPKQMKSCWPQYSVLVFVK